MTLRRPRSFDDWEQTGRYRPAEALWDELALQWFAEGELDPDESWLTRQTGRYRRRPLPAEVTLLVGSRKTAARSRLLQRLLLAAALLMLL